MNAELSAVSVLGASVDAVVSAHSNETMSAADGPAGPFSFPNIGSLDVPDRAGRASLGRLTQGTSPTRLTGDPYVESTRWLARAALKEGSWWAMWAEWLSRNSSATKVAPPAMGSPDHCPMVLDAASGRYVYER